MLAFLRIFFGPNGYPTLKLGGSTCNAATAAQNLTAPGLINCTALAPVITQCQQIGKPILLSLGGATGQTNFTSAAQAIDFASTLWALFGADTSNATTKPIRPFGPTVVLDGFDLDSENKIPAYYGNFTSALRAKYATNTTKPYYISGAPQCPIPDPNLPLDAMLQFDWVWPQFYNAAGCQINSTGFYASTSAWSQQLYINGAIGPRFYIGLAASNATSSGYVPGSSLQNLLSPINTTNMSNFGGIMLWDGSTGLVQDSVGVDYLTYAKNALLSLFNAVRTSCRSLVENTLLTTPRNQPRRP